MELEEMQHQVEDLLKAVCGSQVTLADIALHKRQPDYSVVAARLEHPRLEVMVKLAGPRATLDCPFERTAALLRLVASATSVPVGAVIAADTTYREWPWRYLIYERVPGLIWGEVWQRLPPGQRARVLGQLGAAVGQLHGLRFSAFGSLTDTLEVEAAPAYLAALWRRAEAFITSTPLREYFLAAVERYAGWFDDVTEARLTHEDVHGWNIALEEREGEWRLAGILDFDKAWAGHHESDLARMEFWDGMTGPEFWERYTALQPIAPRFAQRRLVYQLFWCLEFARATPRHLADTRRVCEDLGLPEIGNLEGLFGERG